MQFRCTTPNQSPQLTFPNPLSHIEKSVSAGRERARNPTLLDRVEYYVWHRLKRWLKRWTTTELWFICFAAATAAWVFQLFRISVFSF